MHFKEFNTYGAGERPGKNFYIFTDLERHGSTAHFGYKACALRCFRGRRLTPDENVNRLESGNLMESDARLRRWDPCSSAVHCSAVKSDGAYKGEM